MLNFNVSGRQNDSYKKKMYEVKKNELLHGAVREMVRELEPNVF